MIDEALLHLIKINTAVITHIGDDIYPGVVPESITGPAIRYVVNDAPSEWTGSGVSEEKAANAQIDIFHHKYASAKSVSNVLIKDLHLYKGTIADNRIHYLEVLDSDLLFDEKTREYRITLTLLIKYQEIQS